MNQNRFSGQILFQVDQLMTRCDSSDGTLPSDNTYSKLIKSTFRFVDKSLWRSQIRRTQEHKCILVTFYFDQWHRMYYITFELLPVYGRDMKLALEEHEQSFIPLSSYHFSTLKWLKSTHKTAACKTFVFGCGTVVISDTKNSCLRLVICNF